MISGNQQALKMPITIASVNVTRRSTLKFATTEVLDVKCAFAILSFIRKITINIKIR